MYSYKEERNYSTPTEKIALITIDKVSENPLEAGFYPFQIKQNDGSVFFLRTKKAEERQKWIFEIHKAINPKNNYGSVVIDSTSNNNQLAGRLLAKQNSSIYVFSSKS